MVKPRLPTRSKCDARVNILFIALHNVLFVQYDSPVSKIDPCLLQGYAMETMQ